MCLHFRCNSPQLEGEWGTRGGLRVQLLSEFWTELASFAAGALGGALVTFKFVGGNKVRGSGRVVDQRGAKAGGDNVGGNKTTNLR